MRLNIDEYLSWYKKLEKHVTIQIKTDAKSFEAARNSLIQMYKDALKPAPVESQKNDNLSPEERKELQEILPED